MITGLLLTFVVGLCWSLVGVYYKIMAKYDLDFINITLVTYFFSFCVMLAFVTETKDLVTGMIPFPDWKFFTFVFVAGLLNLIGGKVHQMSMKYGKSGVTWAIGQSYLIVPFVFITLLYHETWSMSKVAGTLLILFGMFVLSVKPGDAGRDGDAPRPKYGLLLAFSAYILYGISGIMASVTSFSTYQDPGNIRPLLIGLGSFAGMILSKMFAKDWSFRLDKKAWLLILCQVIGNVLGLFCQFQALDHLSRVSMNGLFYPIAVGLCIAGYSICSVVFFKEKATKTFLSGTALILFGILGFCVTAI